MKTTLALDIGGTNFSVGIFEGSTLLSRATHGTDRLAAPASMLDQMRIMVGELAPDRKIDACGIGFGGPIHFKEQRVIFSTHVSGWDGFDLIREVERRFDAPAIMDRDTMVGALGEGNFGAGQRTRPLFYVTLSTGIGGGLLTEDGLYRGADSYACELVITLSFPTAPYACAVLTDAWSECAADYGSSATISNGQRSCSRNPNSYRNTWSI